MKTNDNIRSKSNVCFLLILSSILSSALLSFFSFANASTKQWPLRHAGEVRYLKVVKVYDIELYSPSKLTAKNVLNDNISKCLKLDYAVTLSVDKFKLATTKILNQQHSPEYLKTIQEPLNTLQDAYKPVKKGDAYTLCYNGKSKRISLDFNKEKLVEIQSEALAKAYLGIWLSENKPISLPLYHSFFPKG